MPTSTSVGDEEYLFTILANSKSTLMRLKLDNFDNNLYDFEKFHDVLGKCENIETLCFYGDLIMGGYIDTFISALENLKNLTRLTMKHVTDNSLSPCLFEIFSSGCLKNLKELEIIDEGLDEAEVEEMTKDELKAYYDEVSEVIEAIDEGCPDLEKLILNNFISMQFDNGRILYCYDCEVYHLKTQSCPY